jgi:RNase P/RNase MRP subunit p29
MKTGELRKHTYIHTAASITLKIHKGTKVTADGGVLTFNPIDHVQVVRVERRYYVLLWGERFLVTFPESDKTPYPLTLLK